MNSTRAISPAPPAMPMKTSMNSNRLTLGTWNLILIIMLAMIIIPPMMHRIFAPMDFGLKNTHTIPAISGTKVRPLGIVVAPIRKPLPHRLVTCTIVVSQKSPATSIAKPTRKMISGFFIILIFPRKIDNRELTRYSFLEDN